MIVYRDASSPELFLTVVYNSAYDITFVATSSPPASATDIHDAILHALPRLHITPYLFKRGSELLLFVNPVSGHSECVAIKETEKSPVLTL